MQPFPYQQAGIQFLASRTRAALLDEPGLGKTGQAIEALNVVNPQRVLIVSPLIVTPNWDRELGMWAPWRTVQRLRKGADAIHRDATVIICPTSLIANPKMLATLVGTKWDLLIVDEAHHFKNPTASRTVALYGARGIAVRVPRVWILTGTIMPNNPSELWTHLLHIHPKAITHNGRPLSQWAFDQRYCEYEETRYGRKIIGVKRADELRRILGECSLRRKQVDVLKDLPPMRHANVSLPAPSKAQLEPLTALLDRLSDELGRDVSKLTGDELLVAMQNSAEFPTYRRLCGELKAEMAIEWVRGELDSGVEKLVLFANHRGVIQEIQDALAEFGTASIHGGVSADERQRIVDRFQTDPTLRVVVCQIVSGGVGITLTAANRAAFVELDWVPGNNLQASKRIHRIGQTAGSVLVHYLYMEGSVDEHITLALARKSQMIQEVGV